jgi:hypothetical protein
MPPHGSAIPVDPDQLKELGLSTHAFRRTTQNT